MTRCSDGVKDVDDRSRGKAGAVVPSIVKTLICWCTSPGVEEVCGEASQAGAAILSSEEVGASSNVDQREAGEAGAADPSASETCTC